MAGAEWRFIDIYRVENGKLAEHWDAMMQMPKERTNKTAQGDAAGLGAR